MEQMDLVVKFPNLGEKFLLGKVDAGNFSYLAHNDDQSHAVKKPGDDGFRDEVGNEPGSGHP